MSILRANSQRRWEVTDERPWSRLVPGHTAEPGQQPASSEVWRDRERQGDRDRETGRDTETERERDRERETERDRKTER